MQERHAYPSRKSLKHSNSTRMASNPSEVPQITKKTLAKMATISIGSPLGNNNGNEVVGIVRILDFGFATEHIPIATEPIVPLFDTKSRGRCGGGTNKEALRRAKRKAKLTTNHNHNNHSGNK